jgi:nucleoside-diphosphate-sugar epimerase
MTSTAVGPLVMVTGGAGYVGSTLCRELLAAGYRVRTIDMLMYGGKALTGLLNHPNLEFVRGDIRSPGDVEKTLSGDVSAVVHLAAIVGDAPCQQNVRDAVDINYTGTMLLAEKARARGVRRFVFASTCSNYGIAETTAPADEQRPLNPVSLYAETKIDSERGLRQLHDAQFASVILRFATAYGVSARTRFDLAVNSFTYEALARHLLLVYGRHTWRPYIHVVDMAGVIARCLAAPSSDVDGEIFNAGSNAQNYPKDAVVGMVTAAVPGTRVSYLDAVDDRRTYRVDFTKLERRIDFRPRYSVEDGIREIVHAFETGVLSAADYEANALPSPLRGEGS